MDLAQFWWQSAAAPTGIGSTLRFRGGQQLSRVLTATGNTKTFTTSLWCKFPTNHTSSALINLSPVAPRHQRFQLVPGADRFTVDLHTTSLVNDCIGFYRDPAAWYHVVWTVDTTQAVHSNRSIVYVNGVRMPDRHPHSPSLNYNLTGNAAGSTTFVGRAKYVDAFYIGYMAEVHFVDGQALDPTSFGEFNADGVWVPKPVTGLTYGVNGFHLAFDDPANIGKDSSGNGNDFTATGFELTDPTSTNYDWVEDSPTNNYAIVNSRYPGASTSNANLTTANATGKPTILPGTSKTVRVGGASQTWDGTEGGWTYTGDVDFGQRQATGDNVSTANLPAVAITKPSDHFSAILDSGANILTAAQATFPNGLWWIKDRAHANQHQFVDSLRGGNLALTCPGPGFDQAYSPPAGNSVAWGWATPGHPTPNTDGSITSTVDANVEAGFSICGYTGTGVDGSYGHGLSQAPEMIITKARAGATPSNWVVNHQYLSNWNWYIRLDDKHAQIGDASVMASSPTGQVVSIGTNALVNQHNAGYVSYCWHSVPGYSSIGSYVGNGHVNGPFIYTGFRPARIMIKWRDGIGPWRIADIVRSPYNPAIQYLFGNLTNVDTAQAGQETDFLSNGFKVRTTLDAQNASGQTYIYMAFAEHPFGGSNVSPSPAR